MPRMPRSLSTPAAAAMYVGAVLGPGVLLVPALVAREAGPASVVTWAALLALSVPLAATFAALGVRYPEAGGTAAYAQAAFGALAERVTAWWFLSAVVVGAPVVAFAGGRYVATLAGWGTAGGAGVAAAIVAVVLVLNGRGLTATARVQLGLTAALAGLLSVAVATALPHSTASNWTPFAPEGWGAVGSAASLLMFSFIGWEAVSHLVGDLGDPARQLPRAIAVALVAVATLYAGLAVATVGVLGTRDLSPVPIADLMEAGLGATGRGATMVLALVLTVGTMSTYVAGALRLVGTLVPAGHPAARPRVSFVVLGVATVLMLTALAFGLVGADVLTRASAAAFVGIYVVATAAGTRLLDGAMRWVAGGCCAVMLVILAWVGIELVLPAGVAGVVVLTTRRARVEDPAPA